MNEETQLAFDFPEVDAHMEITELPEPDWDSVCTSLNVYLEGAEEAIEDQNRAFNNPEGLLTLSMEYQEYLEMTGTDTLYELSEHSVFASYVTLMFFGDMLTGSEFWADMDDDTKGNIKMLLASMWLRLSHEAALFLRDDEHEDPPFLRNISELIELDNATEWDTDDEDGDE